MFAVSTVARESTYGKVSKWPNIKSNLLDDSDDDSTNADHQQRARVGTGIPISRY